MRQRAFFCLALAVLLASAFSSLRRGSRPRAGRVALRVRRQGGPPPVQLAEGAGREQVQAACTAATVST